MDDCQSGYLTIGATEEILETKMSDIEIIYVSGSNIIARGRRYGRWWLMKGIRKDLQGTAMMKRLIKEFELHSRLRHEGIVGVFGFEEIEGIGPCIVEEWIEGQTLAVALHDGILLKSERRRIMRRIIETVSYIHSRGVVHRDLKPSNIMIRRTGGEVVIIDFGLADSDDYTELKQAGGTPGFIAPEQIETGGAEQADDIYSLGVIIRELCPGYRSMSKKCMSRREKRPDTEQLLKMLDSRHRRLRLIILSAIVSLITIAGIFAYSAIMSLTVEVNDAHETISGLKDETRRDVSQIFELKDSLNNINQQLAESEKLRLETEKYIETKNEVIKNGYDLIDGILIRYNRNSKTKLIPGDWNSYQNLVQSCLDELIKGVDNYCSSLSDPLSEIDIANIHQDMTTYFQTSIEKYFNGWRIIVMPDTIN